MTIPQKLLYATVWVLHIGLCFIGAVTMIVTEACSYACDYLDTVKSRLNPSEPADPDSFF